MSLLNNTDHTVIMASLALTLSFGRRCSARLAVRPRPGRRWVKQQPRGCGLSCLQSLQPTTEYTRRMLGGEEGQLVFGVRQNCVPYSRCPMKRCVASRWESKSLVTASLWCKHCKPPECEESKRCTFVYTTEAKLMYHNEEICKVFSDLQRKTML